MSDDELYDEFGNLIGDPLDSNASLESEAESEVSQQSDVDPEENEPEPVSSHALTVTENNTRVETIVANPYDQPEDAPVLQPVVEKRMKVDFTDSIRNKSHLNGDVLIDEIYSNLPPVSYSRAYMNTIAAGLPERVRNLAIVGNLHTGKTTFIDTLVLDTHTSLTQGKSQKNYKPLRFTDNHQLEIDREMSIKMTPISLLLPDLRDRSYVLNLIDTPGHVNFSDETSAALQAVDGVLLVLDVVEGFLPHDKTIVTSCLKANLPLTVCINKIDRLILELRLPPYDAYYKLKYTIDSINKHMEESEYAAGYTWKKISPRNNNVLFASSAQNMCFTVKSFCELYQDQLASDPEKFVVLMWGDVFFNAETNKFAKDSDGGSLPRTFVHFILEPIYKLFTFTLTAEQNGKPLSTLLWDNFGVSLPKASYKQDPQILLRDVLLTVFKGSKGFVDMVVQLPPPAQPENTNLRAQVVKLTESVDALSFYAIVRVHQGKLRVGSQVRVLGENFEFDEDDCKVETITELYVPGGRYKVPVKEAGAGSVAIVAGIDSIITKGATLCEVGLSENGLKQNNYEEKSVFKVAVEPENPSELPKLLEGFRKLNKSYLAISIKVEESGEHVVLAPGELYLDCALHDLRRFFTDDLDIKVSDPMTKFSETCTDISVTKIPTKSVSKQSHISIIAEPMDEVGHAIETGKISLSQPVKTTAKILRNEFGWDALAARSLWTYGPTDLRFPSVLLDDTLEEETDKKALYSVKEYIKTGFNLAVNEGPLCDEPIRNTKFKILDAVLGGSNILSSGSQIIPMTRNAVHTGLLTATPRLLEPIYKVTATCKHVAVPAIAKLLQKRRGDVTLSQPIPGTPLFQVEGYVPVIDSPGLETDIRLRTQGQAMCFLELDTWDLVPGDPLDKDAVLPQLKPVPYKSLARDFVLKTRKRKGLGGEPSLQKYIDTDLFERLQSSGIID